MEDREQIERVELERLAAATVGQALVEGEVALPGGIREEATVLGCEARVVITGAEVQQDRLAVDGSVVYEVLYRQGGDDVRAMEATSAFSHRTELPGAEAGMRPEVSATVQSAAASASGGRLRLRAGLEIGARAFSPETVSVITGLTRTPGLQSDSATHRVLRHAASGRATAMLREEFELSAPPEIRETLYARAVPTVKAVSGGEGRAAVEGEVLLEVFHAGADAELPLLVTRHTFPFEQTVELDGEAGDALRATARVQDVVASSVDAGDGSRVLRTETVLDIEASSCAETAVTCLRDAYTLTGDALTLTMRPVRCFAGMRTFAAGESDKITFPLPEGAPPIRRVLAALVTPTLISSEQAGGRTVAEGLLDVQVAYLPQEGGAVAAREELPFRIAFPGTMPADAAVRLTAHDVQAESVSEKRVELKYRVDLEAEAVEDAELMLPVEAAFAPEVEQKGGLLAIWPQPGETLWDIAKRLRVTVEGITRLNAGVAEAKPGQGLLVFRRGSGGQGA